MSRCDTRLLDAMRAACNEERWPIYLYGETGRGKSYAMAAAFTLWRGSSAHWADLSQLVRSIIRCRMSDDGCFTEYVPATAHHAAYHADRYESSFMRPIHDSSLVCLDDIGLRTPSEAVYEVVYELLNVRYRRPLIVTGNLAPQELAKVYDARIASRLLAGCVIHVEGKDRRLGGMKFVKV